MSVNTLISNPKILNELVLYVEEKAATNGILSLNNTDGNFVLSDISGVGTVDLSNNIIVNSKLVSNSIFTQNVSSNSDLIIESDSNSQILMSDTGIIINAGNPINNVTFDNSGNFNLNNVNLVLNSSKNIFSTDGTSNQLLSTNGNNTLKWINNIVVLPSNYIKQISTLQEQQLDEYTTVTELPVFDLSLNGFTIGKNTLYKVYFTFKASNVADIININLNVAGTVYTTNTYIDVGEFGLSIFRGVVFLAQNISETQEIILTVSNNNPSNPVQFSSNAEDYYNLTCQEIQ
jgi:hypothetical protein